MKFNIYLFFESMLCLILPVIPQEKFNIAESINQFSTNLLAGVNIEGGDNLNIALSPFTIWTMLTIVTEGALESTADQLNTALLLPQNKNSIRESYRRFSSVLKQSQSKEVEFENSNGIFSRTNFPIKEKFLRIINSFYSTDVTYVDFDGNSQESANIINKYVAKATKNRIPKLVSPVDVENAYLFITSTMYFKGAWKVPFNKTATQRETFFDDKNNPIGKVDLMYQFSPYPYARIDKIKAHAVELPYGFDDTYSMLILLPRGSQTVTNMLNQLTKESITEILARVKKNYEMFSEDDIHVYLPKFKVTSDFNMDGVLQRLGIQDVFNPLKANLLGMYSHYLYLSRVIQKAEIEVDEEGTVASAAAGSIFINRTPPPVVKATRPFAYFIIHKQTGSIIFAGKISNPNTLSR